MLIYDNVYMLNNIYILYVPVRGINQFGTDKRYKFSMSTGLPMSLSQRKISDRSCDWHGFAYCQCESGFYINKVSHKVTRLTRFRNMISAPYINGYEGFVWKDQMGTNSNTWNWPSRHNWLWRWGQFLTHGWLCMDFQYFQILFQLSCWHGKYCFTWWCFHLDFRFECQVV